MTDQQIAAYNNNLHSTDAVFIGISGFIVGVLVMMSIYRYTQYRIRERKFNSIGQYQVVSMPNNGTPSYIIWDYVNQSMLPLGPYDMKEEARLHMFRYWEKDQRHD